MDLCPIDLLTTIGLIARWPICFIDCALPVFFNYLTCLSCFDGGDFYYLLFYCIIAKNVLFKIALLIGQLRTAFTLSVIAVRTPKS